VRTMESVLMLNASWEPLRVLSWQKAIVLVVQERAEIVQASDLEVRSQRLNLPMPSVIRLLKFVKVPFKTKVPLGRKALMARDGGVCQFTHCDRSASTIDHVIPRSRGGRHVWENVVASCTACNHKKADRSLKELGWKLKAKPTAPRATTWVGVAVTAGHVWAPFLEGAPAV
jgi:5-methylcytosine-specific restriction endonuclease McrA